MRHLFIFFIFLPIFSIFGSTHEAEILERKMWADMYSKNWASVEDNIAEIFRGVHWFGIQNREAEIQLIKDLNIQSYEISQMEVTENPDTYIITYWVSVVQTLNKAKAKTTPFPRLSVWQKINGTWKWVAHANLNPREDTIKLKTKSGVDARERVF